MMSIPRIVTLFALLLSGAQASPPLQPAEVVVVANAAVADSLAVARHYMQARGIPEDHLFTFRDPGYGELEPMDQNPRWYPYAAFRERVKLPLQAFLAEKELKDKVLCLVTVYGTPYRVGRFTFTEAQEQALRRGVAFLPEYAGADAEQRAKLLRKHRRRLWESNMAFDSALARLYEPPPADDFGGGPLAGMLQRWRWRPNPFFESTQGFRAFRQQQVDGDEPGRLYMVARLDGPSPEIARGLVDKAIATEQAGGLRGPYCIDARNPGKNEGEGYAKGDRWLRAAAELCEAAGLEGVYDTRGGPPEKGACAGAALYFGWYQSFDYRGEIFEQRFAPGAIGCHIASFAAARMWTGEVGDKGGPWVPAMLRDGVTVAMGPVSEPYLAAFPRPRLFLERTFAGRSVAEAFWASVPHTSWHMILLGDPLYRPWPAGLTTKPQGNP